MYRDLKDFFSKNPSLKRDDGNVATVFHNSEPTRFFPLRKIFATERINVYADSNLND